MYAPEFTPERIRRFVHERLPKFTDAFNKDLLKVGDVRREVDEAIRNPTDRMRKTFQKLSTGHKWVLISLFETGRRAKFEAVEQIYRMRISEEKEPFSTILDDLREAFVTARGPYVDWIHPSYRDLVIEELAADNMLRQRVLTSITLSGLKVAVSDTSGPYGEQKYPLIASASDWKLLCEGCVKLVGSCSTVDATDALEVLASAAQNATESDVRHELSQIIFRICEAVREHWDANRAIFTARQLLTFCQTSLLASRLPALPRFDHSWETLEKRVMTNLTAWETDKVVDSDTLDEWIQLAHVIAENEPRFLRQKQFPTKYRVVVNRIVIVIDSELDQEDYFDSADDYMAAASKYDQLVRVVKSMQQLDLMQANDASTLQERLEERSNEYGERAREIGGAEPDYEPDDYRSAGEETVDLDEFFRDL